MTTTSNNNSSWAVFLAQKLLASPEPLAEKTKYLEATAVLVNAENQQVQAKQDQNKTMRDMDF